METPTPPIPITVSQEHHGAEQTRLHSHWLVLARFAWAALIVLVLAFFLANIPVYFTQLQTVCIRSACAPWQLTPANAKALQNAGLSVSLYAIFSLALSLFSVLVWLAVASFIAWRKSNDWMALLASLLLVTQGVVQFSGSLSTPLGYSSPAWYVPTISLSLLDLVLYILVFSLFPNGRFVPAWMRWLVAAEIPLVVILLVFWFTSSSNTETLLTSPAAALLLFIWGSIIGAQIYRFRRVSSPTERQQTKWVVLGIVEGPVLAVVYYFPPLLFPSLSTPDSLYFLLFKPVYSIFFLFAPLCFGVAILRYRLWDINVLINRTLVYGTFTITLACIYLSLVVLLQQLFHTLTGQPQSAPVTVISTLVIAALFQPLRRRTQEVIDRRFYRRKYDAAKTVEAFSTALRSEVDVNQLSAHLVTVARETMQPAHISLWLRQPEHRAQRNLDAPERFS